MPSPVEIAFVSVVSWLTILGSAHATSICYSPGMDGKSIRVTVANGCVSSSHKYFGDDVVVNVDRENRLITVTGDFHYRWSTSRVGVTDCGSGRSKNFYFNASGRGLYRISYGMEAIKPAPYAGRYCAAFPLERVGEQRSARRWKRSQGYKRSGNESP